MAKTADYALGEFVFPRGWFMIAASDELGSKPLAIHYFGEDMVLYRGTGGRPILVEAYCPHMGTHLAINSTSYIIRDGSHVEGDNIRCPYHGWRFGADGKCNEIPYSPAPIPAAACLRTWQVVERAGCVWMWHDPEGAGPDFELPAFESWDDPQWVQWKIDQLGLLNCHPQEIIDNMADKGHLSPVHGSIDMVKFENEFDGHIIRQFLVAGHRTLISASEPMTNDTWYTGPGILQSAMLGDNPSLILICHTPVDDGSVKVWHGLLVKSQNAVATEADVQTARAYQAASLAAFAHDFEIWANKKACLTPMKVIGDGPFARVRLWYRQFYNPRSQATEFQARVAGRVATQGTLSDPWPSTA
jgi:3-ketosteroid 9alpha-monooxygenase subunit A